MTGKNDRPGRQRRGCRRRILIWLLLPLIAAALLAWYQRDLPRRTVERALAERLGATVRLGSLRVRGSRSFELNDLRVREVATLPITEATSPAIQRMRSKSWDKDSMVMPQRKCGSVRQFGGR